MTEGIVDPDAGPSIEDSEPDREAYDMIEQKTPPGPDVFDPGSGRKRRTARNRRRGGIALVVVLIVAVTAAVIARRDGGDVAEPVDTPSSPAVVPDRGVTHSYPRRRHR